MAGVAVAVVAALVFGASPASAHPMPHSVVTLDVHATSVSARLELPGQDFTTASGIDIGGELPADRIRTYVVSHVKPATVAGQPWTVTAGAVSASQAEQTATGPYRELEVDLVLTPPPGGDVRHFVLGYDVIVHQVVTHVALISVRQDWSTGKVSAGDDATQVGTVKIDIRSMTVKPLVVDLGTGSAWRGFVAMVKLGGNHILTGTDHLLFLLILLLPATLVASGGRWRERATVRRSIGRIARVTIAFTAGHSVALAVSALGRLTIPDRPVEVFIAASILVGAVHAIRPLFPGREALVAGCFGLGHGLAFSLVLAEMHLSTGQLVLSLFGFNIGIELVQLMLVALALPVLLVLVRRRSAPALRIGAATLTGIAALGWMLARLGFPNPVARIADSAGLHTTAMLVLLAIAAAVALVVAGVTRSPEPSPARPRGARPAAARPTGSPGAKPSGAQPPGAKPSGAKPSGAEPSGGTAQRVRPAVAATANTSTPDTRRKAEPHDE